MVISRIFGGLGNQMFQYAFGRALSLAHGTELALDLDALRDYRLHNGFELSRIFNITDCELRASEIRKVLGWRGVGWVRGMLVRKRYSWLRGTKILIEPHFHFWKYATKASRDCYVRGYWQSERYFHTVQDVIREDFIFRLPWSSENEAVRQSITSCEAISLHIRRGDYATDPRTNAIHGICTLDYYMKAIASLLTQCKAPEFFVFSDDVSWAKEHLKSVSPIHFVEHNKGKESYNDMRLMSLCRHHIIANSSFSWWGAWLNPCREKVVIAPRRWFNTDRLDTRDLIPTGWTRL